MPAYRERNSKYVFPPCSGEQVVKSLVCQVFVCLQASMCVCVCLLECRMPLLVGQVSWQAHVQVRLWLFVCLCCLPAGWGGSGLGGDAMCGLLSSLYSNDRPCCFTCCGGRSVDLSLHPLSKTRTQVLPVEITWVSPYVLRPSNGN